VALSGARLDAVGLTGRETQVIAEVQHLDGITRLLLTAGTAFPYDRTSLRLNGNVALATHGELTREDLGSGDSRLVWQQFKLSKPPLTHVSAANETGRRSTLEVRISDVLWHEVAALAFAGPDDTVYEVRHSDEGAVWVRFGDGITGRRLPTGALNVKASYRCGIGAAGEVADEAISLLKTRPLGVRAVVNPSPATGSAERETLEGARLNAPASVRTMGRIVSLTDYADFALGFAGIGKARVQELWSGQQKVVHLTVAPVADADLTDSDPLILNLAAAIEKVRDPGRPLIIQPAVRRLFQMQASIGTHPDYLPADVAVAAQATLEAAFGYPVRGLGQSVSAAEIIAALHRVPGVVLVDLDTLALIEDGAALATVGTALDAFLPAHTARGPGQRALPGAGYVPAELLTLLPSAVVLIVTEAVDA
jgi:predicted phage baseplate assembly protein